MPQYFKGKLTRPRASSSRRETLKLESKILDISQYNPWEEAQAIADVKAEFRSRLPLAYGRRGAPPKARAILASVVDRVAARLRNGEESTTQGGSVRLFKDELEKIGFKVGPGLSMTDKVVRDYVKRIRLQQKPMARLTKDEWIWLAKYSSEDRSEVVKILRRMLALSQHSLRKLDFMRRQYPDAVLPHLMLVHIKSHEQYIANVRKILSSIST